ncbi:hypothetical protein [Streptomyces sp. NPDC058989]|uniref:hypothetical protein n=1 Tax=Streptomyces sp. NPDC058989 TaxID=3346686 RepID=UPI0036BD91D6
MHHNDPFAARVCPHCDGFATAAIDCGFRDAYGHRVTIYKDCPACWGWGVIPRLSRRQMAATATR